MYPACTLTLFDDRSPPCNAIVVACLYQASPAVIQLLLQDYPMGALSAMMGMLPIHMVAVGWVLEPIKPQPIHSSMKIDDGTESNNTQALQVLVQALPESITAKSGYHGMTPLEYVEEHIMEGSKKQECLILLRTALAKSVV